MGSLNRRLESIEARRKRRGGQPTREALGYLSDEQLSALERAALSLSPGEPLPPNPFIEEMKVREAKAIERQRRNERKKGAT